MLIKKNKVRVFQEGIGVETVCIASDDLIKPKSLPILHIRNHILTLLTPTQEIQSAKLGSSDRESDNDLSHYRILEGMLWNR
jgi:hypothetical protein